MHRRTPSAAALPGDGESLTALRLPPRSPAASLHGLRTPSTCPTSPLVGTFGPNTVSPLSASGVPRSSGSTPAHSRRGSVSCQALPLDLPQSHVLPGLVNSVFESNITAAQCYSAYPSRMHTAPPLVGRADPHHHHQHGHLNAATAAQARSAVVTHSHSHNTLGSALGHSSNLLNDINDVDFGLATCLATPMDPGPGLERRLAPLPATTTGAAARTAATKLTSANDILNEASRYGDWVRRQQRRKRLERMQGALAELGASAVLGMLIDDTLHDYDPSTSGRTRRSGGGSGSQGGAAARAARVVGSSDEEEDADRVLDQEWREQEQLVIAALQGAMTGLGVEAAAQQQQEVAAVDERRARRMLRALLDQSAGKGQEDEGPRGREGRDGSTDEDEEEEEFPPARFPVFRDDMAFNN